MQLPKIDKLLICGLVCVLSGCVQLRFSQYDQITELLKHRSPSTVYHPYLWDVTIGSYRNSVLQVDLAEQVGFTNTAQDAILFANNRITALGPLGSYKQQLRITYTQDNEQGKASQASDTVVYTTTTNNMTVTVETCEPWRIVKPQILQQICQSGNTYTNQIILDDAGNMIALSQYIPLYGTRIDLHKRAVVTAVE